MNAISKILTTIIILSMTLGVVGPTAVFAVADTPQVHPMIYQIAAETPDEMIRVVIQKADDTDRAIEMVEDLGGIFLKELGLLNAFVAEIPAGIVSDLAVSAPLTWITLDAPVESSGKPVPIDPYTLTPNTYLDTLGVKAVWNMGYTGAGIGIAIIDSGISPTKDLDISKSVAFNPNATNVTDFYGHGTHVAGIAAGNGDDSNGFYMGIAPGATLYSLKISDDNGMAYESDTVAALQWVFDNKEAYNIRVVNLSIQSSITASYHDSPMNAAAEILWHNGIVIVVAGGNKPEASDFNTTNAAPANDPFFITVGASDEKGTAKTNDDVVTSFTSWSWTSDGYLKPDILAPGKDIISVLSTHSEWDVLYPERTVAEGKYFRLSGTSMASPMVAGAAALLLQAEPNLTPSQVKYRLLNSCNWVSGWPSLNVYGALTTATTASANQGLVPHMLLAKMAMIAYWASTNADEVIDWENVDWDAVNWDAVNWNSVNWNSVNWNAVNWNSVNWNSVNWNSVNWNSVNWNSVNWNSVNWNSVNWNSVNWNSVNWNSVNWNSVSFSD